MTRMDGEPTARRELHDLLLRVRLGGRVEVGV